jgi:hypothetical protein
VTGYFHRLIDRALGRAQVLQPAVPSRFASPPGAPSLQFGPLLAHDRETVIEAPPPAVSARPRTAAAAPPVRTEMPAPAPAQDAPPPPPIANRPELPRTPGRPAFEAREESAPASRIGEPARRREEPPDAREQHSTSIREEVRAAVQPVQERSDRVEQRTLEIREAAPAQPKQQPAAPPPLAVNRREKPRELSQPRAAPEPEIHITIGSIEVRANTAPPPARPGPRRADSHQSLEAYLQKRGGK